MSNFIIQRESIADMVMEAQPLLSLHYEEIAWRKDKIKLEPDWDQYARMELMGNLIGYSGRVGGKLKGYAVFFVRPHLHYRNTLQAINDIIFIHPSHRKGRSGIAMIQFAEEDLKSIGVQLISYHIKRVLDWGPMAERLGYEEVETSHWKWVGV